MIDDFHFDRHDPGADDDIFFGGHGSDVFVSLWGEDQFFGGRGRDVFMSVENGDDLFFDGGRGQDRAEIILDRGERIVGAAMIGDVEQYETSQGQRFIFVSVERVQFHYGRK